MVGGLEIGLPDGVVGRRRPGELALGRLVRVDVAAGRCGAQQARLAVPAGAVAGAGEDPPAVRRERQAADPAPAAGHRERVQPHAGGAVDRDRGAVALGVGEPCAVRRQLSACRGRCRRSAGLARRAWS